jgi:hypothetical protein
MERQLETTGKLSLEVSEFLELFDFRARQMVQMSGQEALKQIREGTAGPGPEWTELALLATLIPQNI